MIIPHLSFRTRQRFKDAIECKVAVRKWAIHDGYNIWWKRSTTKNLDGGCENGCQWRLYGSM